MKPRRPFRGRSLRPQVERVEARRLLATITVTTAADSGPGSLREAMTQANAAPDLDTIAFDIPGQGVRTIKLASELPPVVAPVVIDGYTQRDPNSGDARPNSLPDADDARLLIALDGGDSLNRGLDFGPGPNGGPGASGSTVRGLAVGRFSESGISIRFCDGVTAEGNFIGVDPSGTAAADVGVGVTVSGSRNCVIGGAAPAARNVIGGYLFSGVTLTGDRTVDGTLLVASGNVVAGNFIGVDATGNGGLGRLLFGTGVTVGDFATDNTVGGADPGARNVISDNPVSGVLLLGGDATRNLVAGNFIGTTAGGASPLGNSISGVKADGSGGNTVSGNLISGNLGDGVVLNGNPAGSGTSLSANVVIGNRIGTNAAGDAPLPNTGVGVLILNSDGNTVGGAGEGEGNLVSGNGMQGVLINTDGGASTGNAVLGNLIGTTADGMSALGNGDVGVFINRAAGNTVGGAQPGAGNVISGNGLDGVVIGFDSATGNAVLGNRVGTTADGAKALPNAGSGVRVSIAPGNRVAGNLISGNRSNGLFIFGTAARNTLAQGNLIGTDASGTKAVANEGQGVLITDAPGNLIGGPGPGQANVVSGNGDNGIKIDGLSSGNVLQGNRIGTTADGAAALGNEGAGVLIDNAPGNVIGGTVPGAGNVISGNGGGGVVLFDRKASGNLVQGNRVGTDAAGLFALGNAGDGVFIVNAPGTTVGGPQAGAGNLISGNLLHGVEVFGRSATGVVVANNRIGTDAPGTSARGNRLNGILVTSSAGVSVLNNLASGNGQAGVEVSGPDAAGVSISGNRVGTNAAGTAALGNGAGVLLNGSPGGLVAGNLVSGNRGPGVLVVGATASGNRVQGNLVGVDAAGAAPVCNQTGIAVQQAPDNIIGGTTPGSRNVVSGNSAVGVYVFGVGARGTVVLGNLVGLDVSGRRPVLGPVSAAVLSRRGDVGVFLGAGAVGNTVGSGAAAGRNVISGNGTGVVIAGAGAERNAVRGNYVGTSVTGSSAVSNGTGVYINGSPRNVLGGTTPGSGNVVSGNVSVGVYLYGAQSVGNLLLGNTIGPDASGRAGFVTPAGTLLQANGVLISTGASRNTLGGANGTGGNVVGGNASVNVYLLGPGTAGNVVQSNRVGLPNGPRSLYGVLLYDAAANTVLQTGPGRNTFAGNAVANVREFTSAPRISARSRLLWKTRPV